MRTTDYLDAIRDRYGLTSDYQLHKLTGWGKSRITQWRNRPVEFDESACIQAAELLDLPPEKVLADIQAVRAKTPEIRKAWENVARVFASGATALTLAFFLLLPPAQDAAAAALTSAHSGPDTKDYVK